MTTRHSPYSELCFVTGFELDDPVAADHETRRFRPEQAVADPAGAMAKR